MKLNSYTIYDLKAKRAIQPMFRDNHEVAQRDFVQACTNPEGPFFKNADDYQLFWNGTYNDETMEFNAPRDADPDNEYMGPERIMTGREAQEMKKMTADKIKQLQAQIDFIKENMPVEQQEQAFNG
ncbi:nonstructural protein [Microviridae sp.]|nr:nonstructural protein [Microviridae sp.]